MKKFGYARVSTGEQSLDAQIEKLQAAGCDSIFAEKLSGKNRRRPKLEEMLKLMDADTSIVCSKLDRLGRSTLDLCNIAKEIETAGAQLVFLDQSIDTSNPTGRMMFQMLAVIAEFERSMITSRTQGARKAAMARGKKMGRKSKTSVIQNEQMISMYRDGKTWDEIGAAFGIGRGTVYNRIKHLIAQGRLDEN